MKVAFIGLGNMGFPMAGHLAAGGHQVTVYNRTAASAGLARDIAATGEERGGGHHRRWPQTRHQRPHHNNLFMRAEP